MTFSNLNVLILALVLALNVSFALIALIKNPNSRVNKAFAAFVFFVVLWVLIRFLDELSFASGSKSIVWAELSIVGPIFVPFFFYRFILFFLEKWEQTKFWKKIVVFFPIILLLPFVFTDYNVLSYDFTETAARLSPGPLYIWFTIYFVGVVSVSLALLFKGKFELGKVKQEQAKYIFWGSLGTALLGIVFSSILPLLGYDGAYQIGSSSSIIFAFLTLYAIVRHRFFDLRIVAKKVLLSLVATIPGLLAIYFAFGQVSLIVQLPDIQKIAVYLVILAVIIVSYRISYKYLVKIFGQPESDPQQSIAILCNAASGTQKVRDFAEALRDEIIAHTTSVDVRLFVIATDSESLNLVDSNNKVKLFLNKSPLLKFLDSKKEAINIEEARFSSIDEAVIKEMADNLIDLVIPLFYQEQLIGMLCVDKDGQLFSEEEFVFLLGLEKEITFCLNNVLLYEQSIARLNEQ